MYEVFEAVRNPVTPIRNWPNRLDGPAKQMSVKQPAKACLSGQLNYYNKYADTYDRKIEHGGNFAGGTDPSIGDDDDSSRKNGQETRSVKKKTEMKEVRGNMKGEIDQDIEKASRYNGKMVANMLLSHV